MSESLSATDIVLILGAVGVLVGVVGTWAVAVINALNRTVHKVDDIATRTAVIEGHVNSAATAALSKERASQTEIDRLHELVADQKQVAALLAQQVSAGTDKPAKKATER